MKQVATEKTMTVKEVSEALGVNNSTIRKIGKKLYPNSFNHGKTTYLTEMQVTVIKLKIGSGRNDLGNVSEVKNVKTETEKKLVISEAIGYMKEDKKFMKGLSSEIVKTIDKKINTLIDDRIGKELNSIKRQISINSYPQQRTEADTSKEENRILRRMKKENRNYIIYSDEFNYFRRFVFDFINFNNQGTDEKNNYIKEQNIMNQCLPKIATESKQRILNYLTNAGMIIKDEVSEKPVYKKIQG